LVKCHIHHITLLYHTRHENWEGLYIINMGMEGGSGSVTIACVSVFKAFYFYVILSFFSGFSSCDLVPVSIVISFVSIVTCVAMSTNDTCSSFSPLSSLVFKPSDFVCSLTFQDDNVSLFVS